MLHSASTMERKELTLSTKVTFWQAYTKAQALTNGVQFSREEIQTWNQDIGNEVEDDDQECIATTAEISTTDAIEAFNKVINNKL